MLETTVTDKFKTTQHHHHYGAEVRAEGTSVVRFHGPVVKLHAAAEWIRARNIHFMASRPPLQTSPAEDPSAQAADHHAGGIGRLNLADFATALHTTRTLGSPKAINQMRSIVKNWMKMIPLRYRRKA